MENTKRMFKREIADEKEIISDHMKTKVVGKPVLRRLYKRDTQEMADIEMDGIIQVRDGNEISSVLSIVN